MTSRRYLVKLDLMPILIWCLNLISCQTWFHIKLGFMSNLISCRTFSCPHSAYFHVKLNFMPDLNIGQTWFFVKLDFMLSNMIECQNRYHVKHVKHVKQLCQVTCRYWRVTLDIFDRGSGYNWCGGLFILCQFILLDLMSIMNFCQTKNLKI